MHRPHRPRFLAERFGGNYAPLLAALVLLFAFAPLLARGLREARALEAVYLIVVLLGYRGLTSGRRALFVVAAATVVAYALQLTGSLAQFEILTTLGNVIIFLLVFGLPFGILRDVLTHRLVTIDTIFGSLCVYVLISILAAFVFRAVYYLDDNAFAFASESRSPLDDLLYFSLVTITTVGYGDIIPRSAVARSFAALLALFGQLYLVVLVAYLVGLRITHAQGNKPDK